MKIHELLGIDEDTPVDEIKKAFRFRCPHPDRGGKVEDFVIWQQAFEEWEHSLTQEGKVASYIRVLTRQALVKAHQNHNMIEFTIFMQALVNDAIGKCNENIDSFLMQEQAMKDGIIRASFFKSEETKKTIISELEKQLEAVPDMIAFQRAELIFLKEVQSALSMNRTTQTSTFKKAYLEQNNCS